MSLSFKTLLDKTNISKNRFEGWYFKHQKGNDIVAFIPGYVETGAFIQIITSTDSHQFDISNLSSKGNIITADKCHFSPLGIDIDLPGIYGKISYSELSPISKDIMGPFRFLPMECRHGIVSMNHKLSGYLTIEGQLHSFNGGTGYIEKDSGVSFPKSYLWIQCNDIQINASFMLSIATIPVFPSSFKGCICVIKTEDQEYILATYLGCCILSEGPEHICISQRGLLLEADIEHTDISHVLKSPANGIMSRTIDEYTNVSLSLRLWSDGIKIIDIKSKHASFEYVPS